MFSRIIGLATILLGLGPRPGAAGPLHHDFRGEKLNEQLFRLEGSKPGQYIRSEKAGLRITLPAEGGPKKPVGLVFRLQPRGDFKLTLEYEVLNAPSPRTGDGTGFSIYLMPASTTRDGITFGRLQRPKGDPYFTLLHMLDDSSGKRVAKSANRYPVRPESSIGKLRLVRTGSILTAFAAEGRSANFRELGALEFGPEDVAYMRLAADPGNVDAAVDVRFVDFRLDAAEVSAPIARSHGGRRWVYWSLGGSSAALMVVLLVFRYRPRHPGRPDTTNPHTPSTTREE